MPENRIRFCAVHSNIFSFVLLVGVGAWGSVRAADEQAAGPAAALDEIVVTAQKRSENAQNVPVTISVLSGVQLEQQGIASAPDLIKAVPGLVFQILNGQADPYIRGMGSQQTNLTQESSVGVYVDGVYQAGTTAALTEFADVDHIEVLKGPQGTLFGRNTTGGAINIVTKDPQPGLSGDVDYSAGTWGTEHFKGYIAGGSDVLTASLAVVYAYHNGYLHNLYDDTRLDNLNTGALRGKIQARLSDDWTATFAVSYSENRDSSSLAYLYLNNNAQPLGLGGRISTDPRATYNDAGSLERRVVQNAGASFTVRGKLDDINIVSISAWGHSKDKSIEDQDASDLNEEVLFANQTLWSFSQDLQFLSPTGEKLQWIGGLYYFTSDGGFPKPADLTITVGDNPAATTFLSGQQKTESEAVYGQASYEITPVFTVTAGGRLNRDEKTLLPGRVTEIPGSGVFLGPEAGQSATWNNFSPKGVLEAHLSADSMLYASVSKGFKAGSQQIDSAFTPPVNPETVLAYEIGGKHTFDDNRLRFNWAVFDDKYKNLQVDVIIPVTNVIATQNAASATNYGVDWDLNYAATSRLRLNAGMEWLHATYSQYDNAAVYVSNAAAGVPGLGNSTINENVSGNYLVNAPKVTANIGATYSIPLPIGSLDLNASDSFNGGFYFDANNRVRQTAYSLISARATYTSGNWSVYLYGNNLLNKDVISGELEETFGDLVQYGDPRIIGGGASYRF